VLGLFFIPLFFVVVQKLFNRGTRNGGSRPLVGTNSNEGDTHE